MAAIGNTLLNPDETFGFFFFRYLGLLVACILDYLSAKLVKHCFGKVLKNILGSGKEKHVGVFGEN